MNPMRKILFIMLVAGISNILNAQRLSYDKYWVPLKDKNGTAYSISAPEEFLSIKALARREKSGIPVREEDLPVSHQYIDSLESLGVNIRGSSKWFNAVIIQTTDSLALEKVSNFSFVSGFDTAYTNFSAAEPEEYLLGIDLSEEDTESYYYGAASRQMSILGGTFLQNYGYTGKGIEIAVLDGGFYKVDEIKAFESLWKENRLISYQDFVDPASDIFEQSTHGLGVLSTMAAYIPDTFVGTAPDASYFLFRSENVLSETKAEEAFWVLAAEKADSAGADIITSSLGYHNFPVNDKMNYSYADLTGNRALVTRAAEKAFSKGMIVVASAGNEGNNFEWLKITPPADGKNVLAVGSIDTAYEVSGFSSLGNTTDGRIKPDVMAVGYRTKIINTLGEPSNAYGTSFAAPQVAGLIACLWQAVPEKTNKEIIDAVRKSSSRYSDPDSISGYGIPNFVHALWLLKDNSSDSIQDELVVYPNPFTREFEIQPLDPEEEIRQVDILSSDGKLIHSYTDSAKRGSKLQITQLAKQAPGVYYIVVFTTKGEIVTKLIKQ